MRFDGFASRASTLCLACYAAVCGIDTRTPTEVRREEERRQPETDRGRDAEHQARRNPLISSSNSITSSMKTGVYQHEHDLRGTRLEDALEATIAALDQALIAQSQYVKIIHGIGSGALKTGIRKLCQSSPYTKSFRAGDPAEGGDGVTIIELK